MDEQRLHTHSEAHSNTLRRRELQGSIWTDLGGMWLYNSFYCLSKVISDVTYFKDILPTILLMLLARDKTWRNKWIWFWCIKQASPCDQQPATQFHTRVMHIRTFVLQCLTVTICLVTKSVVDWRQCNWNCLIFKRTNLGTQHCSLKKMPQALWSFIFWPSWYFLKLYSQAYEYTESYTQLFPVCNQYQCAIKSLTISNLEKLGPPAHCCIIYFQHLTRKHRNNVQASFISTKKAWEVPS